MFLFLLNSYSKTPLAPFPSDTLLTLSLVPAYFVCPADFVCSANCGGSAKRGGFHINFRFFSFETEVVEILILPLLVSSSSYFYSILIQNYGGLHLRSGFLFLISHLLGLLFGRPHLFIRAPRPLVFDYDF